MAVKLIHGVFCWVVVIGFLPEHCFSAVVDQGFGFLVGEFGVRLLFLTALFCQ